jgi:hypothetical protein
MKLQVLPLVAVILLTKASVWSATPVSRPEKSKLITLNRGIGSRPIGVEPQGGRFDQVIGPRAKDRNRYTFSLFAKDQDTGIISIFATDETLIPLEKPLARVKISGLLLLGKANPGILVGLDKVPGNDRAMTVWAYDGKNHRDLKVEQVTDEQIRTAKLNVPAPGPQAPKLNPIALGPQSGVPQNSSAGLREFIGYRSAGGMFTPILSPGDLPKTKPQPKYGAYFSTTYPGQTNIDLRLFVSDSPYIENVKKTKRYIISGITPYERTRGAIGLNLQVDGRGGFKPIATEVKIRKDKSSGEIKIEDVKELKVDVYSSAVLARLKDVTARHSEGGESFPALLPPAP